MADPAALMFSVVEQDSPQVRTPRAQQTGVKSVPRTSSRTDFEMTRLKEENKALQLRVLGVNELARLLQDRNEVVQVLEEKNKRLEVAVVRLENRCSNFERKLKAQGGASFVPKPGQSPFIPGPSRQILEALMKENSELKKTLNKVTNKGASGYLEAVKTIQLEEVIEQEKQEIDFLKNQIKSLTSGFVEGEMSAGENSLSVGSSSDTGALKRQLIKMQHSMKVKDRFCTLLSQQVSDMQQKLTNQQQDVADGSDSSTKSSRSTSSPVQELTEHDLRPLSKEILKSSPNFSHEVHDIDAELIKQREELETKYEKLMDDLKETLQTERGERMTLVDKLQDIEEDLKTKQSELEGMERRCDDLTSYNHTLLEEKTELTQLLSAEKEQETQEPQTKEMEGQLRTLNQQVEDQVTIHSGELQKKIDEISRLEMLLDDSHMNLAIAESKLGSIKNEKEQELLTLKDKIDDLETDLQVMQSEKEELAREKRELQVALGHARVPPGSRPTPSLSHQWGLLPRDDSSRQLSSHGGPNLILPPTTQGNQGMVMVADGPPKPMTSPQYTPAFHYDSMSGRPHTSLHCGSSLVDNPIRPTLVSRGFPESPTTSSMEKPRTLNIPPQNTHPYPTTSISPSMAGHRYNLPLQTPTTPIALNQMTQAPISPRSHSPNAYPRGNPSPGQRPPGHGYTRQYTAPVPGYPSHGRGVMYQSSMSMQQQGPTYATSSPQGYVPIQRYGPTYTTQESKESGYNSFGSTGYNSGSLGPRHYERRSSSPQQHDYPYQQ